jgi:alpha-L-arabinofuranosidase
MTPAWFLENTNRYDYYRRDGSQIFVGEYAAHETSRANSWYTALCEAAYITGLERNADIVKMSSYAPLFAREGMYQWAPDMIWFDSAAITTLTPNYKIQKLFSNNTGTKVLPAENSPRIRDLFHASSIDREAGVVYTKLVNPYNHGLTVKLGYKNSGLTAGTAAQTFIISAEQNAKSVSVTEGSIPVSGAALTINLEPYSAAVIRTSLN